MWQVEDLNVEIETLRQQLGTLEKRQKKFDQNLGEEKAISERYVTGDHCNLAHVLLNDNSYTVVPSKNWHWV